MPQTAGLGDGAGAGQGLGLGRAARPRRLTEAPGQAAGVSGKISQLPRAHGSPRTRGTMGRTLTGTRWSVPHGGASEPSRQPAWPWLREATVRGSAGTRASLTPSLALHSVPSRAIVSMRALPRAWRGGRAGGAAQGSRDGLAELQAARLGFGAGALARAERCRAALAGHHARAGSNELPIPRAYPARSHGSISRLVGALSGTSRSVAPWLLGSHRCASERFC